MDELSRRRFLQAMTAGSVAALGCTPAAAGWKAWATSITPGVLGLKGAGTITLGAVVPLTGGLAAIGRYYRDAYRFTIDKINEKGGIVAGGKPYKLSLKLVDSKSKAKLGLRRFEQLAADQGIDLLLGSYSNDD